MSFAIVVRLREQIESSTERTRIAIETAARSGERRCNWANRWMDTDYDV